MLAALKSSCSCAGRIYLLQAVPYVHDRECSMTGKQTFHTDLVNPGNRSLCPVFGRLPRFQAIARWLETHMRYSTASNMRRPRCYTFLPSPTTTRSTKLTITAAANAPVRTVGPKRSSKPPTPLEPPTAPRVRMRPARQWKTARAYSMAAMATRVKQPALIWPTRSPKLSRPTARPPRMTLKLSHDRKVRSLAKKTLGSMRVGRAMCLPVVDGQWVGG